MRLAHDGFRSDASNWPIRAAKSLFWDDRIESPAGETISHFTWLIPPLDDTRNSKLINHSVITWISGDTFLRNSWGSWAQSLRITGMSMPSCNNDPTTLNWVRMPNGFGIVRGRDKFRRSNE
jgi:hypothetical protein